MLFSEQTQSFYSEDLEYPTLPQDVFTIDEEIWIKTLDKINDGFFVMVNNGQIEYSDRNKPSRFYSFNIKTKTWTQTPEQEELEKQVKSNKNLSLAQDSYDDTTKLINSYSEMIEDQDYSFYTKEILSELKEKAITFRKELRSYLKTGDGTLPLPQLETVGG